MSRLPEIWLQCKEPCADCPRDTKRTAKIACAHEWRHIVEESIDLQTGEVPFDTPEKCRLAGATVRTRKPDQKRPSVEIFTSPPAAAHGYINAKIRNSDEPIS